MSQLAKKMTTFSSTAVLAFSISTGVMAQETTQLDKEKSKLGNLYSLIINVESCAELQMFFNSNDVKSLKENSLEATREFKISEADRNAIWTREMKRNEGALFFVSLSSYAEQFEYCSTIRNLHRLFSPKKNTEDENSSERPF